MRNEPSRSARRSPSRTTRQRTVVVNQVEAVDEIEGLINDLADHEPAPEPETNDDDDDAKSEAPTEGTDDGADADDEGDAPPRPPRPPETTATNVEPEFARAPSPPAVPPDVVVNLPVAAGMARGFARRGRRRRAAAASIRSALGLVRCDPRHDPDARAAAAGRRRRGSCQMAPAEARGLRPELARRAGSAAAEHGRHRPARAAFCGERGENAPPA